MPLFDVIVRQSRLGLTRAEATCKEEAIAKVNDHMDLVLVDWEPCFEDEAVEAEKYDPNNVGPDLGQAVDERSDTMRVEVVEPNETIIRAPRGAARREIRLMDVVVPDLWHIAMHLQKEGDNMSSVAVLECWYLCHDLLLNLKGEVE